MTNRRTVGEPTTLRPKQERHLRAMRWTPPPVTASMCQGGCIEQPLESRGITMEITTVGIDLAKSVFQGR